MAKVRKAIIELEHGAIMSSFLKRLEEALTEADLGPAFSGKGAGNNAEMLNKFGLKPRRVDRGQENKAVDKQEGQSQGEVKILQDTLLKLDRAVIAAVEQNKIDREMAKKYVAGKAAIIAVIKAIGA